MFLVGGLQTGMRTLQTWIVMGKSLDNPEKGNVNKMSEECRKKNTVRKLSKQCPEGLKIFGHFLANVCLFGLCFCMVTLSNVRPPATDLEVRSIVSASMLATLGETRLLRVRSLRDLHERTGMHQAHHAHLLEEASNGGKTELEKILKLL